MNAPWSELLGHSQQSLVGRSFAPFVHPDDAQFLVRQLCDPDGDAPPEAFEAALADQGAEALPDPVLEFPAWLQDLRAHWAGAPPEGEA